MFRRPGYADSVAATFVLYGAPTVTGSLHVVDPEETVVVRLASIFSGSGYRDERNPVLYPNADWRLAVGVTIFAPEDEMLSQSEGAVSENTLPIRDASSASMKHAARIIRAFASTVAVL